MKTKKRIFLQDTALYSTEILVCCGVNYDETVVWVKDKNNRIAPEGKEFVIGSEKAFEFYKKQNAMTYFLDGRVLLLLPKFEDSWEYWQSLIHELHHIVYDMAEDKSFEKEPENQAYLQGYLFRSIRRKLQGIDKA